MTLSAEQTAKLEEALRARGAAEQRVNDLSDAEECCVATVEVYAAFDALLKTARLELRRLCWIVHLLESGKDCTWQR
jgi:hypothetical protein